MEQQPSQEQLLKLYQQYQRKKQYNAEYMKKFRQDICIAYGDWSRSTLNTEKN